MTQLNKTGIIDVNYSVTPPPAKFILRKAKYSK